MKGRKRPTVWRLGRRVTVALQLSLSTAPSPWNLSAFSTEQHLRGRRWCWHIESVGGSSN